MVRSAVRNNKYAIGYVSMAYINSTVKALKVGGVYPNRSNASGSSPKYKYVRPLYWVTDGAPKGAAKSFIGWTLTKTGQNYVAKEFLPQVVAFPSQAGTAPLGSCPRLCRGRMEVSS